MTGRYHTNDLHLAATLQCLGLELIDVDRTDLRRVRFVFIEDERRRRWTREYLAGELRVDPLILLNSFRTLKRQIYADTRPGGGTVTILPGRRPVVAAAGEPGL